MRQNFFLFLLSPFFLFATIEIAKDQQNAPPAQKRETAEAAIKEKKTEVTTAQKKEAVQTQKAADQKALSKKTAKIEVVAQSKAPKEIAAKENSQEEDSYPESAATVPSYLNEGHQKQFFVTLLVICVFILFALIVIYIFKRASPMSAITRKNSRNNIKILERRSLSPQTYLYHIQVGDKQFILSESKVEVRSVATLDWTDPK